MSLFATIQGDAAEAQEMIAQMGGKAPGGTNTLHRGAAITLAYGDPRVAEIMRPGGYHRRVEVVATATRSQFAGPPASKETLTRTDMAPPITYRIDTVDTHDPIRYTFVLIKVGE